MDDPITISGVLLALGVVLGLGLSGIGALAVFGAGMATVPDEGMAKGGCLTAVIGLAILVRSLWGLIS